MQAVRGYRGMSHTPYRIDEQDLELRTERAAQLLEEQGVDIGERDVLVGYDMNGPMAEQESVELRVYPEVKRAMDAVPLDREGVEAALISGWNVPRLETVRDDQLDERYHVVGELGAAYAYNGAVQETVEGQREALIRFKQELYRSAAEEGWKIAEQGNVSSVVGNVTVEGEGRPGDPRGRVYEGFPDATAVTTDDLWDTVRDHPGFTYAGGMVLFEDTSAAVERVHTLLTGDFPYTGVRFEEVGDRLGFYRDRADAAIDIEEAHTFLTGVAAGTPWTLDYNEDWSADHVYSQVAFDKEAGANALAQDMFATEQEEDYLITHVGDKAGDVMRGENAFFFPQVGTPAHTYCLEEDVPHVAVVNAADYAAIVERLLDRNG